jgi:hypothetical protein
MTIHSIDKVRGVSLRVSSLILAGFTSLALAQQPVVSSRLLKAEASVTAINPATREVTLEGPKGPFNLTVDEHVKNLDKVHVGDKVVVSYYEGIAARMAKGGAHAAEPATSAFAYRNAAGANPGGGLGASATGTVMIEDVDPSTNTVAFRSADGTVHLVAVRSPDMQQFIRTLKRGDHVEITYTQSVAVNVVPQLR